MSSETENCPSSSSRPVVLTAAGSDCSSGAGIQADLKTVQSLGGFALTAVASVVSEVPMNVRRVLNLPVDFLEDQLTLLADTYPISAAKTGMLPTPEHVRATAQFFQNHPQIPLIVDPVMIATSGQALTESDSITAYEQDLLPHCLVMTPNLDEAMAFRRQTISNLEELKAAADALSQKFGCATLLKGGHLQGDDVSDVLVWKEGIETFSHPRIPEVPTHGTGCTFSAALAFWIAKGFSLPEATFRAKEFIVAALKQALCWKTPKGGNVWALEQGPHLS